MLRGIRLYGAILLPFLVLPFVLWLLGADPGDAMSVSVLLAIIGGLVATIATRQLYQQTRKPRSIFYGMLVSGLEVKVAFGTWIGYLVAAGLLDQDPYDVMLPLPSQPIRQFVTLLAAIVFLVSPVYYYVTIRLEMARSGAPLPEPAQEVQT